MRMPAGEALLARELAWERCTANTGRCRGVRLDHADRCIAHADPNDSARAFQRLADGAPLDFARGVEFTGELLGELLGHAPLDGHRTMLRNADFTNAVLADGSFYLVNFHNPARFNGATFHGDADFRRTSFDADASFRGATFNGAAWFHEARFTAGEAGFGEVTFKGDAEFVETAFLGDAFFPAAVFDSDAVFVLVGFAGDVTFRRASFRRWLEFGPVAVNGTIELDDVAFGQPVHIEIAASVLSCQRTRFLAGGHLQVAHAEITLADAELPSPLILAHQPPDPWLSRFAAWMAGGHGKARAGQPLPRLVSVQRADVGGLVLADIDLRECRFAGAHHLDQLQLSGDGVFHRAPGRWGSARQVLAEERAWRQRRHGWRADRWGRPSTDEALPEVEGAPQPGPTEIAGIYRQLRKGREAARNEPGAGAFYYGECEMRRHAPSTPPAEKLLLTLYWLASGYGLRAWRAVAGLAALVAVATIRLHQVGFVAPAAPPWPAVMVFAAECVVSLETKLAALGKDVSLTAQGEALRLLLRLAGPTLLALTVLAFRNRVKR